MPRQPYKYNSKDKRRRLAAQLQALKLKRERLAYSEQRRARIEAADAALDYLEPALITARAQLRDQRIEAEIKRIYREIRGYARNGGETPSPKQREASQEAYDERRAWAMIEDALRAKSDKSSQ